MRILNTTRIWLLEFNLRTTNQSTMKYKIHLPIVFLASLLIFTTVSCNDSIGNKPTPPGMVVTKIAHITYTNKAGNNLLNSTTIGAYNHKEIRVYYVINGHKKLAIDSSGYSPNKGWGGRYGINNTERQLFFKCGYTRAWISRVAQKCKNNNINKITRWYYRYAKGSF